MYRRLLLIATLSLAWLPAPSAQQPAASACSIGGSVSASSVPLPGVVLTLKTADGRTVDASSTSPDGSYALKAPGPGAYKMSAELLAFAAVVRDVTLGESSCRQRIDLAMTLASRVPAEAASVSAAPAPAATPPSGAASEAPRRQGLRAGGAGQAGAAGGGRGGRGGQNPFQSLTLVADEAGGVRLDEETGDGASQLALPAGFTPDSAGEAVTSLGSTQSAQQMPFGQFDPAAFRNGQFGGFGDAAGGVASAAPGPGGGRGGPGFAGQGGPGGFGPGPFAGRLGNNQIRGSVFQSFDTSAFDAAPFSLNGQPTEKADYLQQRFGATIGGPLTIPKVWSDSRTFFFLNYTGNHSSNPYTAYSTVPTLAERAGDFSALGKSVINPATGQPFAGNQIPASMQSPSSLSLLSLIPEPNQPGTRQNFLYTSTATSQLDDINVRIIHNFGDVPQRGQGGRGGAGGGGRGAGGGRFGGGNVKNLNVTIHFRHSDTGATNPFPTLGGESTLTAWDIPGSYSFTKSGYINTLRFDFNRQHTETQNLFAYSQNIAGNAGIQGVSTDPFDWGSPNLSFSNFTSLRDMNPTLRNDRTISFGETTTKTKGRQTFRIGGDFRAIQFETRNDPNARGSYVFTGLYTGYDFSDFLLGYPQQSTAQYGAGTETFNGTSWDLFAQDDWRVKDSLTLNLGVRYEYYSPYSELENRLVTLDAPPDFTAAVPVLAGQVGPYSGPFPNTIVRPDRNNFAPRVGFAWRPKAGTVVRGGYGINYSASVYQQIALQLAAQPPFAYTNTVLPPPGAPIPMDQALAIAPTATSNSYGIDPGYRTPFVQIWNFDVQRDITRTVTLGFDYTGTKGSDLDLLRAPNRTATGALLIPDVLPFIWESAIAYSNMNAVTFSIRKRFTDGFAASGSYTLSKALDDASSIAGGTGVVAQNDQNLAAEYGLSNFDQRQRFTGTFTYELPFGPNKKWLDSGVPAAIFGGWVWNGTVSLATGTPFTARVIGAYTDVAGGVNGTLRANYNGAPVAIADPTVGMFFNTSAFSVPPLGQFGDAGRNTIIGPGVSNVNLGLTRNIPIGQNRMLSVQVLASNVFNIAQYSAIDTAVNSPTFGQITAARAPRQIQVLTRFRF